MAGGDAIVVAAAEDGVAEELDCAAHAAHDLPHRAELAEATGNVALDVLELQLDRTGVERQRPVEVIVTAHGRHFLALCLEETLANAVVPHNV